MKSTAHIKGHPIHPILIVFPIAFLIGTFVFDILAVCMNRIPLWHTGKDLEIAGIAAAVVAAIPGAIDYFMTVPPHSSGKKRASIHAILNLSMVGVFIVALIIRMQNEGFNYLVIVIEAAGVTLICIAGWMGGTLVYRNQIGVYNRYASAGKWNKMRVPVTSGKVKVATADELKTDQMKLVVLQNKRVVIGRSADGYVAFDDHCTHKGGSLADGVMICNTVQCPWHGSQFDVKTGEVKAGPAKENIGTYKVIEEGNDVYLVL
ncbi:MAG TPA: DUF2231 domain-containing protein [Flavipsychrobacter sp.]|nr:DUF2231 domain-containing protein [Flavipsychrobacter sp.]